MQLSDIDCTVFRYDPSKDYELDKLVKSHEDYQQKLDELDKYRKRILRYIILMYDMHTPLRLMFTEDGKRKMEAANLAGFNMKRKNSAVVTLVEDVLLGKNAKTNKMIIRYVLGFYNPDYLRLIVFKEMMGQMARNKMGAGAKNITPSDIKVFNELSQNIENLQLKIFSSKESRELREQLYQSMEQEYFNLEPTMVARELKDNEDLFKDLGGDLDHMELSL